MRLATSFLPIDSLTRNQELFSKTATAAFGGAYKNPPHIQPKSFVEQEILWNDHRHGQATSFEQSARLFGHRFQHRGHHRLHAGLPARLPLCADARGLGSGRAGLLQGI